MDGGGDAVLVLADRAGGFDELRDPGTLRPRAPTVEQFDDLMIYWGAQLGLDDEVLISGRLGEVISEIRVSRAAVRESRGWVMDTYLLRPPS